MPEGHEIAAAPLTLRPERLLPRGRGWGRGSPRLRAAAETLLPWLLARPRCRQRVDAKMTLSLQQHIETCPIMSRITGRAAPSAQASPGTALLADGYRPFFLMAGLMAAVWVPLWLAIQQGATASSSPLPANVWHGHEMISGYAVAVLS